VQNYLGVFVCLGESLNLTKECTLMYFLEKVQVKGIETLGIYHTVFKHLNSRLNVIRLWKRMNFLQLFFSDIIISCSFQLS